MRFAIVRDPLGNTGYFAGYRYTNAFTPYWSSELIQTYMTKQAASEVASEIGGIVVMIEVHYSKPTPTMKEIDNLTLDYDGDL